METKINKFIYWTPRVLSILFLIFLALFSLDVFDMNLGFWGTIVGFFMHNIPVFILAIVLWISWKYEIVGGIFFILAAGLYITNILIHALRSQFELYMLTSLFIISGPALLIGILFLINWFQKKKK